MLPTNQQLIELLRCWDADNIERGAARTNKNCEIFTPTALVQEMLAKLPEDLFVDPSKTVCDPSCGNGQFLSEVLIRKLENGIALEQAIATIYGVDIMLDNVEVCRERLLCGVESLRHIVNKNIVWADALHYNFEFE